MKLRLNEHVWLASFTSHVSNVPGADEEWVFLTLAAVANILDASVLVVSGASWVFVLLRLLAGCPLRVAVGAFPDTDEAPGLDPDKVEVLVEGDSLAFLRR